MQTYNRALSLGFNVISERNRIELWPKKNGCNQTRIAAKGWLFTQAIECDPMFDCFHSYDDLSQLRYQRHIEINKEYFC